MPEEIQQLRLDYGRTGRFQGEILARQLVMHHRAPKSLPMTAQAVQTALAHPLNFPDLGQAVLPDDKVVVAIDVDTPHADLIFAELWRRLSETGLPVENLKLIQPAAWRKMEGLDPRGKLPAELREALTLHRHDPTQEDSCAYLASTSSGERVYLSRSLVDADVVMTIGTTEFDPVLGVRVTASSLYPGLSDVDTLRKAQGQGHEELGPNEIRPFRQLVDEIGWLLGLQLSISVIPAGGTAAHEIIVGQTNSVQQRSREILEESWLVNADARVEQVLVTVTADAGGHGWEQVAAAIDAARRLVERNGRIVVLSQLSAPIGPGLEILKSVREPRDALRPIQKANPPDLLVATRIAAAADWANVTLLSQLPPQDVSDLFMVPIEAEREISRLLENEDLTAIIESAQHAFVQCGV